MWKMKANKNVGLLCLHINMFASLLFWMKAGMKGSWKQKHERGGNLKPHKCPRLYM